MELLGLSPELTQVLDVTLGVVSTFELTLHLSLDYFHLC